MVIGDLVPIADEDRTVARRRRESEADESGPASMRQKDTQEMSDGNSTTPSSQAWRARQYPERSSDHTVRSQPT